MPNYPSTLPRPTSHRGDWEDTAMQLHCTGHYYPAEEQEMRAAGITIESCLRHEAEDYVGRHRAPRPRHMSADLVDSATLARCTDPTGSHWTTDGSTCPVHNEPGYVGRHADTFLPYAVEVSSLDY